MIETRFVFDPGLFLVLCWAWGTLVWLIIRTTTKFVKRKWRG